MGKKAVFLVGDPRALVHAVKNDKHDVRLGRLLKMLHGGKYCASQDPASCEHETSSVISYI